MIYRAAYLLAALLLAGCTGRPSVPPAAAMAQMRHFCESLGNNSKLMSTIGEYSGWDGNFEIACADKDDVWIWFRWDSVKP